MTTVPRFLQLLQSKGSDIRYVRKDSTIPCPCRTPEGFRDPEWHKINSTAPLCDESGMLPDPANSVDKIVKGFMQPIQSTRATRLAEERRIIPPGEIQLDDHLGIFPYQWTGTTLNFRGWGRASEDFVEYAGQRFTVVNANLIPDPDDGNPYHHWEIGARLISDKPIT